MGGGGQNDNLNRGAKRCHNKGSKSFLEMCLSVREILDMANGRGTIDCCYCRHFGGAKGYPDGLGRAAKCNYHEMNLPEPEPSHLNRICCHFEPDDTYWRDNPYWIPPARRFSWFHEDLKPGVLYFFRYNSPEKIVSSLVLREPNHNEGKWGEPRT